MKVQKYTENLGGCNYLGLLTINDSLLVKLFKGLGTAVNEGRTAFEIWSRRWDLNPRPADYESAALPLSYAGPILQILIP